MGLHSIIIMDLPGNVLLARYFKSAYELVDEEEDNGVAKADEDDDDGDGSVIAGPLEQPEAVRMSAWEEEVRRQTMHLWKGIMEGGDQVARGKGGVYIVFRALGVKHGAKDKGRMFIFVCGSDEFDELTLAGVLKDMAAIVDKHCSDGKGTARATDLLNAEAYGKICLAIDEMASGGILEDTTLETVLDSSKLKELKV